MRDSHGRDATLRVAINAQIVPERGAGGVESILIGLVHALGQLTDGPEDYLIIGPWEKPDWLKPYLGPNQRLYDWASAGKTPSRWPARLESIKRASGFLRPRFRRLYRAFVPPPRPHWPKVPLSDGFYENLGCDVIHFPYFRFTVCALPFVYNPHDLQHRHYPEFFTAFDIAEREMYFFTGCRLAQTIAVASEWVKEDIICHYRTDPEKIQVVPWAPPTRAYSEPTPQTIAAVKEKFELERAYAFYPSMLWEHKNHLRMVEAIGRIRDQDGIKINVILTGKEYGFWTNVKQRIAALNLEDQIRFLGLVPRDELRVVYKLAQFVLIPTLFEAASGPLFEAWQENVPVACSAVTSLPQQAGDAALLFNPYSVDDIRHAVKRMATDPELRDDLRRKGALRLQAFSWQRTAKAYRAIYRRAARKLENEEDRSLLRWDWMRDPHPPSG